MVEPVANEAEDGEPYAKHLCELYKLCQKKCDCCEYGK